MAERIEGVGSTGPVGLAVVLAAVGAGDDGVGVAGVPMTFLLWVPVGADTGVLSNAALCNPAWNPNARGQTLYRKRAASSNPFLALWREIKERPTMLGREKSG